MLVLALVELLYLPRVAAEHHSLYLVSIHTHVRLHWLDLLSQYRTLQSVSLLHQPSFEQGSSSVLVQVAEAAPSALSRGERDLLVGEYKYLEVGDVLDALDLDVLLEFDHVLGVVVVVLLHFVDLALVLVAGLAVGDVLEEVVVLLAEVAHLLLEDLVHALLVHFPLLLGGEAHATGELLHVAFYALGHKLTRHLSQVSHHIPPGEARNRLFFKAEIDEFILDFTLAEFPQVSVRARNGLGVLYGRV